jgi:hypothetical protein
MRTTLTRRLIVLTLTFMASVISINADARAEVGAILESLRPAVMGTAAE